MKLNHIQELWEKDSIIDRLDLGQSSLDIAKLHVKYFKIYSEERLRLKKLFTDLKKLYKAKYEYYTGTMSEEELKFRNWEPMSLRIMKNELSMYLEADDDLINQQLHIDIIQERVDFLESIIKSLSTRGFNIKSAIDWMKFTQGS